MKLFRTFSVSIGHNKIVLAFISVVIMGLGGFLLDFTKTVNVAYNYNGTDPYVTELDIYTASPASTKQFIQASNQNPQTGVFTTLAGFISQRFTYMVIDLLGWQIKPFLKHTADIGRSFIWVFKYHPFYSIIYLLFALAVLSIFGGAISRIVALELARGDKIGAIEALAFTKNKFTSLFFAPLLPVAIIASLGVFVLIFGLIANIPYVGEIALGLFSLIAFILGAVMTLVVIAAFAGGSMMFPVIAYESSDCFDAISRTFSYVYTRPWHLFFYYVIAAVYGSICYIFVRFFAFMILSIIYMFLWITLKTDAALEQGLTKLQVIWNAPKFLNLAGAHTNYSLSTMESIGSFFIKISVSLVIGLIGAFLVSYFFTAVTTIYALMRKKVDNVPITDINAEHNLSLNSQFQKNKNN